MAGKAFGKSKTTGKPVTGTDDGDTLDTSANTESTRINGGDGDDMIIGTDTADRVNAGDGDDTVRGGLGDDILFGNDGTDTAVFSGSILDYVWNWARGNTLEVSGADGNDQLKHFEYLQFDDFTYSTDGDNAPISMLRSAATTEENTALTLSLDLYDFDGDEVSVVSVSSARGTVSVAEGLAATQSSAMGSSEGMEISFDPGTDFDYLAVGQTTTETITLVIEDSNGNQTTATYDITVTGSNDAPTLAAALTAADEDGAAVLVDLSALGDDVDSDDDGTTLTYTVTGAPSEGSATITGTTLSFDPGADFQDLAEGETRDVEIQVTATDSHLASAVNTVTVRVTGTNDAPVAAPLTVAGDEDTPINGTVTATDVDNGASLEFSLLSGPANGTVSVGTDGSFTYLGDMDFNGTDSFVFQVDDGLGGVDTETVTVNVAPVNDDPVATGGTGSVTEDDTLSATGAITASDVDGDSLYYSVVGGGTGTYGTMAVNGAGTWTYTLNNDAANVQALAASDSPVDSFDILVSDGNGGYATATVDVTVNGADEPVTSSADLAVDHLAAGSVVGITTWGNYSTPSASNEPYNMAQAAQSFGYSTSFTNAMTDADMRAYLAGVDALVVSEMERSSYPSATTEAIADFVADGGTLVVAGTSREFDIQFMNETFGWSLAEAGSYQPSEFNIDQAEGTVFEDNVSSMPAANAVYDGILTSSLPEGSLSIYNFTGYDDRTSVAVMGHGEGQVTFLAYDYYSSAPNGYQDGGWVEAFRDALSVAAEPETMEFNAYSHYGYTEGDMQMTTSSHYHMHGSYVTLHGGSYYGVELSTVSGDTFDARELTVLSGSGTVTGSNGASFALSGAGTYDFGNTFDDVDWIQITGASTLNFDDFVYV